MTIRERLTQVWWSPRFRDWVYVILAGVLLVPFVTCQWAANRLAGAEEWLEDWSLRVRRVRNRE
jgi:hypothetical protein